MNRDKKKHQSDFSVASSGTLRSHPARNARHDKTLPDGSPNEGTIPVRISVNQFDQSNGVNLGLRDRPAIKKSISLALFRNGMAAT